MSASGHGALERLPRLLFGLRAPVSRRDYVAVGFTLMALKYVVDALVLALVADVSWTPIDYLNPLFSGRAEKLSAVPESTLMAMAVWTLPFIWVGAVMTMRRALDAGSSAWLALLFFLPFVNYVVMLALAVRPTRQRFELGELVVPPPVAPALRSALIAVAVSGALGFGMTALVTFVPAYGMALFFGTPFLLGVVGAFLHNRPTPRTWGQSVGVSLVALLIACGTLLLFALEGIVCIAMALGIAVPVAAAGATLGWSIATFGRGEPRGAVLSIVLLPLLHLAEARFGAGPTTHEVVSVVIVDAPPERVWEHVVSFSELPPPTEFLFATGVAYPLRARIEGEGVGAVRHCEFSTGAFVEPITTWNPPRRLAFDVASQPDPMEEWSFYSRVRPPHLESAFRSVRGEFRLIALDDGRTRLEGSTWYELDLAPRVWWRFLAGRFVHTIHGRVLEHVRALAEAPA